MSDGESPLGEAINLMLNGGSFENGLEAAKPHEVIEGSGHFVIRDRDGGEGQRHLDLSGEQAEHRRLTEAHPNRPRGFMRLTRHNSFVAACKRFGNGTVGAVYADPDDYDIVAYFNHFPADDDSDKDPGWNDYGASLKLKKSSRLQEWLELTSFRGQEEFAQFIEDHNDEIEDGATFLDIAKELQANTSGHFHGRTNLDNGSVAISFMVDHEVTVEVPRHITIAVPLFEHGDRIRIKVRVQFRFGNGSVTFGLRFPTIDDALDAEFERLVQEIEDGIDLPVFRGSFEED